jgi:hypothetical protein
MTIGEQVQQRLREPMGFEELWKWIKIVIAIFALGGAWAQLNAKLDAQTAVMREATTRGERMERYLSSKDPNYWQTVKQLE